jgi:hypothetical protein
VSASAVRFNISNALRVDREAVHLDDGEGEGANRRIVFRSGWPSVLEANKMSA